MKTFCVAPWYAREIDHSGLVTACCLLSKKHDIDTVRAKMLDGQRPSECDKCWRIEDQAQRSDRQMKNSSLDWYWNRDIESIYHDAQAGNSQIRMLTVTTSAICNAHCVTCSPHYSTSWRHLERHNTTIPIFPHNTLDLVAIEQHADLRDLIMLTLRGGEPLYEKQNFQLLERLLELGNSNVFVSIVTNGGVELSDSQRRILAQFPNVNFCISIDGIGPVFEYMRYPLKWDQLLENLKFFQSITNNISASYTISNVNVPYYIETRDWFQRNNIPYNHNLVYNPEFFQPRALPQLIKNKLKQTFSNSDYQSLIGDDHTQHDEQLYQQCQQELARQDRLKGIQAQDYLPAFDFSQ